MISFKNHSFNTPSKLTSLLGLFLITILTFSSCENFLQGEDIKNEIVSAIEYNNAQSYEIDVECKAGSGVIKTPAIGEVTKKVSDTFTVRFEPADDYKFKKWEAVVGATGVSAAEYVSFENPESLETKVTFNKAPPSVIVIRPVCPQNLGVSNFNLGDAEKEYPKDSSIILTFNQPIAEECIENISVKIPGIEEGKDYRDYFKAPELIQNNQIAIYADWDREDGPNYIPVPANGTKTIVVTVPKNKFYYICKDYLETQKITLNSDLTFTYRITDETSKQTHVKFLVDEDTKGTLRVNDENANELTAEYSVGKTLNLRYKPNDGYFFDKWVIKRTYPDENGVNKTDIVSLDELDTINLSLTYPDNEDTLGVDTLTNVAQAVLTVKNYITGDITVSPVNKPCVNITFAVDDEEQGTLKIDDKSLDTQASKYSVGKSIKLKYKPAEGYVFSHWVFKSGDNEVLVNSLNSTQLAALTSTFNLSIDPEIEDITQPVITINDYREGTLTIKPVNKPRNKVQFMQLDDELGTYKVDDVLCDNKVHSYSIGKTVALKFKVSENYKFIYWKIAKIVLDEAGKEQLEELDENVYSSYLTLSHASDDDDSYYNEATRTASMNVYFKEFCTDTIVIYPYITTIPYASVYIDGTNGKASPATGFYSNKEGTVSSINFTPDSDYEFLNWQIIDKNTGNEIQNGDYIYIPSLTEEYTTYTVVKAPAEADNVNIAIKPVLTERPQILSYTPLYATTGVKRDTTIKVMFDYDMDEHSFYYTDDELIQLRTNLNISEGSDESAATHDKLLKTVVEEQDRYYGYVKSGKTYFKNIVIKNSNTDENLLSCFNAPIFENPRTLTITVKKIENEETGEVTVPLPGYTAVFVSIEKDAFYIKNGKPISMSGAKKWVYQLNNGTDQQPPEVVGTYGGSNNDNYPFSITDSNDAEFIGSKTVPEISALHFLEIDEDKKLKPLKLTVALKDDTAVSNALTVAVTKIKDSDYNGITNAETKKIVIPYTEMMATDAYFTGKIPLENFEEGVYRFRLLFNDQSNNTLSLPQIPDPSDNSKKIPVDYYFAIDSSAPVVSEPSISEVEDDGRLKLSWDINEIVDCKDVKIEYKTADETDYTEVDGITKAITEKEIDLSGGTKYDFKFTFEDYSGNKTIYTPTATLRPNRPLMVGVTASNNSNNNYGDINVKVKVDMPDSPYTGHFTGLRIRYYPTGTTNWTTLYTESSDVQMIEEISSLDYGTIYEFEVCSYDSESGKCSIPYKVSNLNKYPVFTTKPASPGSPSLLANTSTSQANPNTSIVCNYKTPDSPFTKLWVYYRTANGSYSDTNRVEINDTVKNHSGTCTISNLTPGTQYYLKFVTYFDQLVNKVETGSDWIYTRPENASGLQLSSRTNSSITMTWTAPSRGLYSAYKLFYKEHSESTYKSIDITGGNTTSYTVTELKGSTQYDFKIQTRSPHLNGWSLDTDSSVRTEITGPDPIANFAAVNGSSSSSKKITLTWTNPTTAYTNVKIYYSTSENGSYSLLSTLSKGTTSYIHDNLPTGSTYYYKITTINGSYQTDSEIISCSTSINAPSISSLSPVAYNSSNQTDQQIKVTWTNPDDLDGIKIYKDSISESNLYRTITSVTANYSRTETISGYSPNQTAKIYVVAYKKIGTETFTASATAETCTYSAPVTGVSATALSPTSIRLNWTNPSNSTYYKYVYIWNTTDSCYVIQSLTKGTTSYDVTGLTPGKSYSFKVRTRNAKDALDSVFPTATITPPPAAPTNIRVSTSTSSTATNSTNSAATTLTWNAPASGSVTGYKVYYSTTSGSWSSANCQTVQGTTTTLNLATGTQYYFKVESYITGITNLTDGSSAATTSCRTYPTAARGLTVSSQTTNSIKFTWTKPAGTFTDQKLYYKKSTDSSWSSTGWLGSNATSTTISNLTPGATYYAYVYDYSYSTSYANSCSTYTTYTIPAIPTNVTVSASNGGTKVSWSAPSGVVSGYYLYYQKPGYSSSYKSVTGTSYTFANSDLTNNTNYSFWVYAYTSNGSSSASSTTSFYTPPKGINYARVYQDDGMGSIKIEFKTEESTSIDFFVDGEYLTWDSYGTGTYYKDFTLSNPRTTSHTIRIAPYHENNSSSGDTADFAQKYKRETYGPCGILYTRTDGNLYVNGTLCLNSNLNTVIKSMTYISNTGTTYASHYDGAFPKSRYVYLSPYSIGAYEVTYDLFKTVMGSNPSTVTSSGYYPVNNVNWYDAIAFCNKLSVLHGLTPYYQVSGYSNSDWGSITWANVPHSDNSDWNKATYNTNANGYRLPTECEHEFAARGGDTGISAWSYSYPGSNTLENVAWIKSNSSGNIHAVGTKPSNRLGLYDMSGNIKEWLNDWNNDPKSGTYYNPYCSYSSSSSSGNTSTPSTLSKKESKVLLKGGYYGSNDNAWNDSNGDKWGASNRDYSTGFRICRPKTY